MPFTVSTNCPSCGGGLEFEQGVNAVHCSFCGSDHLVTGHGRVLSYYIHEKVPVRLAGSLARVYLKETAGPGWRVDEATLFFVPYYRFTGQVMRWDLREEQVERRDEDQGMNVHISVYGYGIQTSGGVYGMRPRTERRFRLAARHVDRTLAALDATGLGMSTLGIRPEVLKLALFAEGELCARGMRAPVTLDAAVMDRHGFATADRADMFAARVYAKQRSLIFFPLWIVEAERRAAGKEGPGRTLVVVDAVAGSVVGRTDDMTLIDRLAGPGSEKFEAAGMRPLKCPNCAAGLAARPKDVVFFCGGCHRAWYIDGGGFTGVRYTRALPRIKRAGEPEYLPFWVVRGKLGSGDISIDTADGLRRLVPSLDAMHRGGGDGPLRFYIPAFQMGNLNVLSRLAASFLRFQPELADGGPPGPVAGGAFLTPGDAADLAPMIFIAVLPREADMRLYRFGAEAAFEPETAELVLVPFYRERTELIDGIFGQSIPQAALKD